VRGSRAAGKGVFRTPGDVEWVRMRDPLNRHLVRADTEAFVEVVRKYEDVVFCAAKGILRDVDDAEDASQEAFLRLWSQRGRARKRVRRPKAWVLGLAVFVAKDALRGRKRVRREEQDAAGLPPRGVIDRAIEIETREDVRVAISMLAESQRDCIVLRYFVGLSYREISDALRISIRTVGSQIAKAKQALKRILTPAAFSLLCLRLARPRPIVERIPHSVLERGPVADLIARARIQDAAFPPSAPSFSAPGALPAAPVLVASAAGVAAIVVALMAVFSIGDDPVLSVPAAPAVATAPAEAAAPAARGADPDPLPVAVGIRFSGSVVTMERGEPVSRPVARLRMRDGRLIGEVTGDGEGRFEIAVERPADLDPSVNEGLVLTVAAEGFLEHELPVAWSELDGREDVRIDLVPASAIDGWTKDEDGRPLAGVEVAGRWKMAGVNTGGWEGSSATTGEDGRFVIACPARWAEAHFLAMADGKAWSRQHWPPDAARPESIELVLPDPVVCAGSVVDERGSVVPGARVALQSVEDGAGPWRDWELDRYLRRHGSLPDRTEADDLGRFSIAGLPAGRYEIRIAPPPDATGGRIRTSVDVRAGAPPLSLRIPAQRIVSGLVLLPGGKPAGRARFWVYGGDGKEPVRRGITQADGTFQVDGLEPGRFYARARLDSMSSETLTIEPGDDRLVLQLFGSPDVPLPGRISLRVTVAGMRVPAETIRVDVLHGGVPTEASISHTPDGTIQITGLPVEPVDVFLRSPSAATRTLGRLQPSAEDTAPIAVDLHTGLTYRGVVEGESGITSGSVKLYDPSGAIVLRAAPLSSGGSFEWVQVDPGPYRVQITIGTRCWTEEVVLHPDGRPVRLGPAPPAAAATTL